jgi:uncharacterized protein YndB with AHSA1/START domain
MGTWWPLDTHSIAVDQELPQKAVDITVEALEGGRVREVLDDGSTRDWAEVTAWDPPNRVVLAWKPNDRPTPPTELEVRFSPEAGGTLVEVDHRGWERLGPVAEEIHPLYDSENGWTMVLDRYRTTVESSGS